MVRPSSVKYRVSPHKNIEQNSNDELDSASAKRLAGLRSHSNIHSQKRNSGVIVHQGAIDKNVSRINQESGTAFLNIP